MSDHADKQPKSTSTYASTVAADLAPGKRTLTELRDEGASAPVQRHTTVSTGTAATQGISDAGRPSLHTLFGTHVQRRVDRDLGEPDAAAIHASAQRGIATPGSPLPHLDAIQRAFGRHDVRGVTAHTGPAAAEASRALRAEAYASDGKIAFATGTPSLHTAAHEAAHVVQQRGGVQLKEGVGETGDVYEQHADAVADRVAAGQSAEAILDRFAASGMGRSAPTTAGPSGAPIQRMGKETLTSREVVTGTVAALGASALVLTFVGASPWVLIWGGLAAVAGYLAASLTRPSAAAVPMRLSGNELAALAMQSMNGLSVEMIQADKNPDDEAAAALRTWKGYAKARSSTDRKMADTVTMADKLLKSVKSSDRTMVIARDLSGIQAVARLEHSDTSVRVATVVANPDPSTKVPGAGQALLMYAAQVATHIESKVPKTVTLEAAHQDLVPYYERLGFKRN